MNACVEFWDKAFDELEEKYIAEAAEKLYRHLGKERELVEIVVDKSGSKPSKWHRLAGIAAAVVLAVTGIGFIASIFGNGEIPISESPGCLVTYDSVEIIRDDLYGITIAGSDNTEKGALLGDLLEKVVALRTQLDDPKNGPFLAQGINYSEKFEIVWRSEGLPDEKTIISYREDGDEVHYFISDTAIGRAPLTEEQYKELRALIQQLAVWSTDELLGGDYYPEATLDAGVYIRVDNIDKTIGLYGKKAYDFVYEYLKNSYGEETAEREAERLYESLCNNTYRLFYDNTAPVIKLETEGGYKEGEYSCDGDGTIYLFDTPFRRDGNIECVEFSYESSIADIEFTDVAPTHMIYNAGSVSRFESEEEVIEQYLSFTSGGISRIGNTVAVTYSLDLEKSFYDGLYNADIHLHYRNDRGGEILVAAASEKGTAKRLRLPDERMLYFSEENTAVSVLKDREGNNVDVKIGGVYYKNEYYMLAEWKNEKNDVSLTVTGSGCELWEFINTVAALVCDVDGLDEITHSTAELETDFGKYTMDMSIFYNYFRGVWNNGSREINIGWTDDIFSRYSNSLIGFYRDEKGAYMAGEYGLWFIPEGEGNAMYSYTFEYNSDASMKTVAAADYDARYEKTGVGDVNGYTGVYGEIGIRELCSAMNISYDSLFDLGFTDDNGVYWYRNEHKNGFVPREEVYVSYRSSDEVVIHLDMITDVEGDAFERQYFSFCFVDDGNGFKMTDEHYPFDISVITHEGYPTEYSSAVAADVELNRDNMYQMSMSTEFFPLSDGSCYAVRTPGTNQDQFKTLAEVFYDDGGGFKLVSNGIYAAMGRKDMVSEDNNLYILHGEDGENGAFNMYVTCFADGALTSRYPLGETSFISEKFTVKSGVVTYSRKEEEGTRVTQVNFTDPYNPVLYWDTIVVEAMAEPQKPVAGYELIDEIGEKYENSALKSDGRIPEDEMYYLAPEIKDDFMVIEKAAYNNGQTMVIGSGNGAGFTLERNHTLELSVIPNFKTSYNSGTGELVSVGYIYDDTAYELYSGYLDSKGMDFDVAAEKTGEYLLYITNCCAGLQNYREITVEYNISVEEIQDYEDQIDRIIAQAQQNAEMQ